MRLRLSNVSVTVRVSGMELIPLPKVFCPEMFLRIVLKIVSPTCRRCVSHRMWWLDDSGNSDSSDAKDVTGLLLQR